MKGYATREIGFSVWQKSFHDHIIRTEQDYQMVWQYIENNPLKWEEDIFYPKTQKMRNKRLLFPNLSAIIMVRTESMFKNLRQFGKEWQYGQTGNYGKEDP